MRETAFRYKKERRPSSPLSVKLTVATVATVADLACESEFIDVFICHTEASVDSQP